MTRRLLLSYLSLTLLVLLALEVPFALTYAGQQQQRAARELDRQADVLAELAEEAIEEDELDMLPRLAARYADGSGGQVLIVGRSGDVLAAAAAGIPTGGTQGDERRGDERRADEARADLARTGLVRWPQLRAALEGDRSSGFRRGEVYYAAAPATSGATVRGAILLTMPTRTLDAAVHRLWLTLLLVGTVVLGVVALLGRVFSRSITRPVRALEEATDQLASGTLTTPAATDLGPPELRRLAATFNQTAARLQRLLAAQRGFAGDASHQLRTPLTALRLRVENLEPNLAPAGRSDLDAAVAEIDRLAEVVDRLLALARLEDEDVRPEPVDLDAVIATRADIWAASAVTRRIRLVCAGASPGPVWAVPGALEQVLDNLLANAMRAAPADSVITIAWHASTSSADAGGDRTVALHVIDQGPGLSAAQRLRAFDRFWRAPGAPSGGSGLGLAIVQRLVEACGGRVELRPASGRGLDATVVLKSATPAGRAAVCPDTDSVVTGSVVTGSVDRRADRRVG